MAARLHGFEALRRAMRITLRPVVSMFSQSGGGKGNVILRLDLDTGRIGRCCALSASEGIAVRPRDIVGIRWPGDTPDLPYDRITRHAPECAGVGKATTDFCQ